MARISGKNGRIYVAITSGGTAEPLPFAATWTINASTDKTDVTAMGDTNKTYVSELPDASGSFEGFYDDASAQTYTAASDGLARKFYLYPNLVGTPGQYFFGTILADFSTSGGIGDAVKFTSSWSAASQISKVG